MQINNKFRYKLYKFSLLLFFVQVVFTIPIMSLYIGGRPEPFILTIDDFKELAQWDLIPEISKKILFSDYNCIANITCLPIIIGLIISFNERRNKFVKLLLAIIIIFEILTFIVQWIITPVFFGSSICLN